MNTIMELHEAVLRAFTRSLVEDFPVAKAELQAEVTRMETELFEANKECDENAQRGLELNTEINELLAKLATLEAEKAEREKQEPVAIRYKYSGDLQWQYTENHNQPPPKTTVQTLHLSAGAKE